MKNELIYPCLGLKTNYFKRELRQLLLVFKIKIYAGGKTRLTKFKLTLWQFCGKIRALWWNIAKSSESLPIKTSSSNYNKIFVKRPLT